MVTFLSELHFWTFDSDVSIKETDFGAFSYHDSKKVENVYDEAKRCYAQKREMVYVPQNKKANKLKESIKYLEEELKEYSCLYCQWFDESTVVIMLSSGLCIYVQIDIGTGDIDRIVFDKYLVGKLSDRLSDAVITKNYIICTYNDTQVTLINFLKPKKSLFDKISKLDPKVSSFELHGPTGRRLEKKVRVNRTEDLILIWWKYTMNEVYPWSPKIKEHDRANVHFYRVSGTKLDLLCYLQTEFDPLCVSFSTSNDHVVHSIEQKVSRKGEVTVEWRTYEITQNNKLQRIAVVSIPLPTHTSCVKFSTNQEILLLCCIDGSVTLHDYTKGSNITKKAAFIPTMATWHSDGRVFAIGNERGQLQHFDISLSCVKTQLLNEECSTSSVLDLSCYFRTQSALVNMDWCKKTYVSSYFNQFNRGDVFFLLLFERGPLAMIKIIEGENITGDSLIRKYLSLSQLGKAISLLDALNWNIDTDVCMQSLNLICNHIFKLPLNPERENLIQTALGTFHVPAKPLNPVVLDKYAEEVRDLTRRFFHHLLRYQMFETAWRLAIDLNDHDLFMDIHFYATVLKDEELANAARDKAEEIASTRTNSHSTCSRSSCSICVESGSDKDGSSSECWDAEEPQVIVKKNKIQSNRRKRKRVTSNVPPQPIIPQIIPMLYPPAFNGNMQMNMNPSQGGPLGTPSYNYSIPNFVPNVFLPTVSYHKNPRPELLSNGNYSKSCDSLIPTFASLSLTPSVAQTSLNSMSLENVANSYQVSNFINQSFPTPPIYVSAPPPQSTPVNSPPSNPNEIVVSDIIKTNALDVINVANDTISSVESDDSVLTVKRAPNLSFNDSSQLAYSIFDSKNNVMSTSFNEPDIIVDEEIISGSNAPPPVVTSHYHHPSYVHPQAEYVYSKIDSDRFSSAQNSKSTAGVMPEYLQRDTMAYLAQTSFRSNNLQATRKYQLDYDLDYVPFGTENFENMDSLSSIINNVRNDLNAASKPHNGGQYTKVASPFSSAFTREDYKKPQASVTPQNSYTYDKYSSLPIFPDRSACGPVASDQKPKVKFSDTVTHILVPKLNQPYGTPNRGPIDPRKELSESLPVYLGNDDYLKNFQKVPKDDCDPQKTEDPPTKIKVVHFGLL